MAEKKPDRELDFFKKMALPRFVVERRGDEYIAVQANELALKYFDLSTTHVVGHPIENFMDSENATHFGQAFEVCFEKKRSVTIQAVPKVPGSVRVYGFYISPVIGADGEIDYLDVIGQLDLSDRSILQRERDDALTLMTSIFEISDLAIVVTDESRHIVRANDAFIRIFGWSRDELINADVVAFVAPEEQEKVRHDHEELIRTGENRSGEVRILCKSGHIANALITTSTLELSQKRRYQVTTLMDITARKKMEESLRYARDQANAANRAKSSFLANMSHELRTPMNAIIGFSEMIMKETYGELGHGKYKEYIGDVHTSACHLLDIINEVLDMSKIEAGRIELHEGEFDLRDTIQSVTRMIASRVFAQGISLRLDFPHGFPGVRGDERLLRQALINIVTNAVKFSRNGGKVDVSGAVLKDGSLQVKVIDNGIGISKDKIQQALEPFGQVFERAENSHDRGTGLGLPLAKAMIDLHQGRFELFSEVGKGTTVCMTLPAERIILR